MNKRGRSRRYDVAFYVPRIGPLLVRGAKTPAGGAETQILLLARALAQRGSKVCLLVFDLPGIAMPSSVGDVAILVRPPYRAHEPLGKLREVMNIRRAIASADAEVVVTRIESPEVGIAGLLAKLLGRRFIYSSANVSDFAPDPHGGRARFLVRRSRRLSADSSWSSGFDFSRLPRKRRDWELFRLGIRLADEVVVQTEEQVHLCKERFGRSPVLIRSIAELARQRERDPEAFLWIGRIVQSKRPDAFVELAHSLPDARFWIVGVPASDRADDAELMKDLERRAATAPNLELLPPRPRGELMDLIERAVAVVNTADFEGMPNIFLEGWTRGVPALVLTHDPDGVIERHGLGAFARGSSEALVDLARLLWEKRRDQAELAARCRRYILEHHSPDDVSARWEEAIGIVPTPTVDGTPLSQ